jgi:hypothetical protein
MTKKRQDHSWDKGIIVTALGKAMKASPGPARHIAQLSKLQGFGCLQRSSLLSPASFMSVCVWCYWVYSWVCHAGGGSKEQGESIHYFVLPWRASHSFIHSFTHTFKCQSTDLPTPLLSPTGLEALFCAKHYVFLRLKGSYHPALGASLKEGSAFSDSSSPWVPESMGVRDLPDSATSEMGTPCSWDMKPRMEKTTNPATKLVALFRKQRAMESLWELVSADKDGEEKREEEKKNSSGEERVKDRRVKRGKRQVHGKEKERMGRKTR